MTLLNRARMLARRFGVEVARANSMTVWYRRFPELLERNRIGLVIDVGANDGGFAADLLQNGYTGRVLSFEPLPSAWTSLNARAQRSAPNQWIVAPQMAIGDRNGDVEIIEAGNSVSSSLLPMSDTHLAASPASASVASHRVAVRRLDDALPELGSYSASERMCLKIDVQGAEGQVLSGAEEMLAGPVKMVQLEMSLAELYEGQVLACELDRLLISKGFHIWDMVPGFRDPKTLRLLQYDGIYVRSDQ